ncbi:MAG: AAA family ATPase [Terracidiphilus sp.]
MSVAIVDADMERGDAVSDIVRALRPSGSMPRVTRLTNLEDPQALKNQGVDVVLLSLDGDKERSLRAIDAICHAGGLFPIVYGEHPDGELLIQCMRAGVREFLHYPFEQDVIQDALHRRASRGQLKPITRKAIGKSFVFLGAKGGSGVTTAACNFAVELAQESQRRTLLIDLDLPLGDAALCLGITSEFSTLDALGQSDRLDATYLSGLLSKHASGLYVLGAPGRYLRIPPLDKSVDQLLAVASKSFDYVVVDGGAKLELADTRIFDLVSTIFLVTQVSVPEMRNSNRLITECLQDYTAKIEVIWNRYTAEMFGIDDEIIEGVLTLPAQWRIPNDFAAVRRMQDTAEPLQESAGIRRAMKKIVAAACGVREEKPDKKKAGLFGFLRA